MTRFVFRIRWFRGLATQGYPPLRQYALPVLAAAVVIALAAVALRFGR